jgi:4-hydroxy-2-oxoheptanedioate aldolase
MLPKNHFKAALAAGKTTIGLWNTIPGPVVAELLAGAGFDWVLIDTEHSPTDVQDTMGMMQAMAGYPVSPLVRVAANDAVLIKRVLDLGAQTLMVPYVQTVDDARRAVEAMRYPPRGIRGMGGTTRATRYGTVTDYVERAEEELCLLVQVETAATLPQIEAIAAVDGVDGLFIGPNDLSATMGFPGQVAHPAVVAAIEDALRRIDATGKAAGILVLDPAFAKLCMGWGSRVTCVGVDVVTLATAVQGLLGAFPKS